MGARLESNAAPVERSESGAPSESGEPSETDEPTEAEALALAVAEVVDGERRAFREFLALAIGVMESDLQRIENGVLARDATTVSDAAHRLAGTCGSIHSGFLRSRSSAIEVAARAHAWERAGHLCRALRRTVAALGARADSWPR